MIIPSLTTYKICFHRKTAKTTPGNIVVYDILNTLVFNFFYLGTYYSQQLYRLQQTEYINYRQILTYIDKPNPSSSPSRLIDNKEPEDEKRNIKPPSLTNNVYIT